jgi:hypothetical protein
LDLLEPLLNLDLAAFQNTTSLILFGTESSTDLKAKLMWPIKEQQIDALKSKVR